MCCLPFLRFPSGTLQIALEHACADSLKQNSTVTFGNADTAEGYENGCFYTHLLAEGHHPSVPLKSCFHSTSLVVLILG